LEGTYSGSIFSTLVTDRKTNFRFLIMGHDNQNRTPSNLPSELRLIL
jgi:hypothetical protein